MTEEERRAWTVAITVGVVCVSAAAVSAVVLAVVVRVVWWILP